MGGSGKGVDRTHFIRSVAREARKQFSAAARGGIVAAGHWTVRGPTGQPL